jgi:uncharacterized protein YndB with AHSA1/START domain
MAAMRSADVVRVRARTAATPDQVWDCLADPYSFAHWVSGTATITGADRSWPDVGSELRHRFGPWPLRFADHTTVLASEPPDRLLLRAGARPFGVVRAELRLTADGAGTTVELCEQLLGGPGLRWPRLGHVVQRLRNRRSLSLLVALVERRAR